ncbi:MAG: hypothetical protein IT230_13010 [Flavobacteriales bacterium]|nr:hypothetical protein [Flavobacteriales bacterium]
MKQANRRNGLHRIPAVLVCGVTMLHAGELGAQNTWSFEQYTSENGLLQNRVHAMEHDPWGALLIGTEGGLVRFDGENFKQIGISAPEGMRPGRVLEIVPVPGKAYVIRDAGSRQYLYKNDALFPITDDAPARKPLSRFAGMGVSAQAVVRAMDPDSTLTGKPDWPYSVRMIPLDATKWCLRTDGELLVYNDTALVDRFAIPRGKWSHLFTLDGHLYMLDTAGRGYVVDLDLRKAIPVPITGLPVPELRDGQPTWRMNWDQDSRLVSLIAGDALYLLHTTQLGSALVAERIPLQLPTDCRVGALVWLDNGQALAVGTDTKGLFLYRRNTMNSLLCEAIGEGVNNAYFAQAPYGRDGVISSTRGRARIFNARGCADTPPPVPGFDETAILLDHDQRYWYGRGDTLFQYDAALAEERMVQSGLRPLCFLEAGSAMYIGTAKGIFKAQDGALELANPMNESDLSMRPTALCMDSSGVLWVATCSGVYKANTNGGWSPVPGLERVCARALAVLDDGIFIGTYGSGAFVFRSGQLYHLPMDNDGFLSHVHAFMADGHGFLWMSTNQGLFRVRRKDLQAWTQDSTQQVYFAYYGKKSGIRNSEFNGGCSPAFVRTADGWASFPTMDGLVWFRPEDIPDAYPSEKIQLESVVIDGKWLAPGPNYTLDWDHRELVVGLSLAYWGSLENARLEYALANGSGQVRWTPLRPGQHELRLTTLRPGETTLRVRKLGAAFRGDADMVELRFIIPTPFYRSFWFIGLCLIALLLLFWAVVRLNAARLRRKNLQLERIVRQRTGELTDANNVLRRSLEMKEMLVSIISHDIVTPLRFIARVSNRMAMGGGVQEPDRLRDTLEDIARSSDKLHANAQGLLQWIKRQDGRIELRLRNVAAHPFVDEVLAMERERASEKGLKLLNEVPFDDVLHTDRNVLSIVLHNLVANAVTHTRQGQITVSGGAVDGKYRLEVRDTGSGMGEAALKHVRRVQGKGALGAMNEEGERDVQGLGLLIVADLLELLGGSFHVESTKDRGTAILLHLPQAATNAIDPAKATIGGQKSSTARM